MAAAPDVEWHSDRPAAEAAVQLGSGPPPTWDPPTDEELAALDALGKAGTWALQGRELKLTNLDKVLFPGREGEAPVTKRELIRYHARVAPVHAPLPVRPAHQPQPVPRRGRQARVLAQGGARATPPSG